MMTNWCDWELNWGVEMGRVMRDCVGSGLVREA